MREEEDIFHLPFTWCTSGLLSSTKEEEEEEEEELIENRTRVRRDFNEVAPARCRILFRIVHSESS